MFSPASLEAQKLISVSIGKINASRVTRTGTSLHKSLLVASVLQKARNVYLDEERERHLRYPQCPLSSPPEVTVTPMCNVMTHPPPEPSTIISDNKENRLSCHEDEVATPERIGEESRLPLAEANTGNNVTHTTTTTTTVTSITNSTTITTTSSSQSSRKRRRVSDQETAAAISSILPKRLRSELKEECLKKEKVAVPSELLTFQIEKEYSPLNTTNTIEPEDVTSRIIPPENFESTGPAENSCEENVPPSDAAADKADTSSSDDSDSDADPDDSTSDVSAGSGDEMEVDQLTSLVSYFSFSQSQKQPEFCLGPIHSQTGPHVVALTA